MKRARVPGRKVEKVITLFINSSTTFTHGPADLTILLGAPLAQQLRSAWSTMDGVVPLTGSVPTVPDYISLEPVEHALQFPLKHYQEVTRTLSRVAPEVRVNGISKATLNAMLHAAGALRSMPPRDDLLRMVPPHLMETLYEYQKDGVAFAVAHGGRALIADEMGVGKSLQGIALLGVYQWEWPACILCPSSLKGQWVQLVDQWLKTQLVENPRFRQRYQAFLDDQGQYRVRCVNKGSDPVDGLVNVISYDMAGSDVKAAELKQRNIQVYLLDESHKIKSRTAKRVVNLLPVLARSKRLILLTGTPSLNRPSEIFPQIHLLRRDVFSSFHTFGERYCAARKERFGWVYDGHSNLTELNSVLETLCMIRRTKADVQDTAVLPPKHREKVMVKLQPAQLAIIQRGVEELKKAEQSGRMVGAFSRGKGQKAAVEERKAAFMALWREIGRVKIPSVIEYCAGLLDQGEKFVLFAHHQMVLDELEAFLTTRRKVQFIRIDGKTASHHRTPQVDRFQQDPEVKVALLSITAAGVGLTLTAAHVVIFAELYFTCGALAQAEDRCHRIGQQHPVSVRYLLAEHTADEQVWYILAHKMKVLGELFGEADTRLTADRSVYDQEIRETDMAEFINAIVGSATGGRPPVKEPALNQTLDFYVILPEKIVTPPQPFTAPEVASTEIILPKPDSWK